jgi:DNA-binding LacI/PurR family transcriptional regulator
VTRLLTMPNPPTAVFFTNPLATVGGLRRCHELGVSVPGELSIVGFDDSDTRQHTWPAYASVCQDASMLGYEASLWLTRCLASGERTPMRLVRPTFLEINKTTARPPNVAVRILPDGSRAS